VLKMKALEPLLSCVCVPPPAPKVCPCPRGCMLLGAWGPVRESRKDACVLAAPPKGCFPWGGGQGSPPPALPGPLGVCGPLGGLGALWGSPAPIWGSAGLLHLSGAVSQCPLHSLLLPQRHGAILEKQLLMENKPKQEKRCYMAILTPRPPPHPSSASWPFPTPLPPHPWMGRGQTHGRVPAGLVGLQPHGECVEAQDGVSDLWDAVVRGEQLLGQRERGEGAGGDGSAGVRGVPGHGAAAGTVQAEPLGVLEATEDPEGLFERYPLGQCQVTCRVAKVLVVGGIRGAVGDVAAWHWRLVGAGPLDVEEVGVEPAATWSHLQPCVGERERRWAGGTLQGHPPSRPPSPTSPGSAPGTWGGGGRGGPRGVSCCAGGMWLGIGEESRFREVKQERWPQVFGKLSGNGISWARIRQARAGTLARSC